jgi:hypothetical protein
VHAQPGLERGLGRFRDRYFAFSAALAAHEQPQVPGVSARAAQVAGDEAAQLGRAQSAVAEHAQQRVVALAASRAPIPDAQHVLVFHLAQGFGRAGLVARHLHASGDVVAAELARRCGAWRAPPARHCGRPRFRPSADRCRSGRGRDRRLLRTHTGRVSVRASSRRSSRPHDSAPRRGLSAAGRSRDRGRHGARLTEGDHPAAVLVVKLEL